MRPHLALFDKSQAKVKTTDRARAGADQDPAEAAQAGHQSGESEVTRDEAAAKLNGNQYREEGTADLFRAMRAAGLVAVYGASDDLMEFEGAIRDEVGCYGGGVAHLTKTGLLENECESDECPHFKRLKAMAATIKAVWDNGGFSWRYETKIPHSTFVIKEDDENYCEGIVFALADVPEGRAK